MSDLMPCQVCDGGRAELLGDDYDWPQVGCECGIAGPYGKTQRNGGGEDLAAARLVAVNGWNDMMALIARGKLLEEEASERGTKGRL